MTADEMLAEWCKGNVTKETAEQRLDAAEVQPATSEMLCGFVLGAICSLAVIAVWNWKF